jgi:cytochrome c-type biogenesis protein CcmH/NrfG
LTVFLSISSNFTNKIVTKLGSFSSTYTGVSYNFIKPKINISLGLGFSELRHGKIFGSGPISFYQVWQKEKPQSVINSNFWGTDFTSSYSTFTTLFVTLGIFAALLSLLILGVILFSIWKKLKKSTGTSSYLELDEENKFYLLASSASFIFSAALFLFFSNVSITLVLLAISTGLILSNSIKWKEEKVTKTHFAIFALLFIFVLIGLIMIMNRVRATSISSNSIKNYQVDQNINKLENGLLRAARISNDDSDYRLLSQFYIFKTQQLLNSQATNTELLQKEVVDSINNGIATAKAAINLGKEDYNNYTTLGSVYSFLMTVDKENREVDYNNAKEAYNKAYSLYPKNPSIFLSLANLEYAYSKNLDFTAENLKKSLEIKPNYSSAFYLFSQLAVEANDKDSAINYAAQAIQADSQNVDAYLQYGILILNKKELNQEELNQAYTAFMSVLNLDRNNLTAAYYLSVTYILAQDYNNADQIIAALEKVLPDDQRIVDLRKFLQTSKASTPQNIATATTTKKK